MPRYNPHFRTGQPVRYLRDRYPERIPVPRELVEDQPGDPGRPDGIVAALTHQLAWRAGMTEHPPDMRDGQYHPCTHEQCRPTKGSSTP